MAMMSLESVIVGKIPSKNTQGQISLFSLPQSFGWVQHFTASEIAAFLNELLEALNEGQETGDWGQVEAVVDSWKETANLIVDTEINTDIETGLHKIADGEGVSWESFDNWGNVYK